MTEIERGEINATGRGTGSLGRRDRGTVFLFYVRDNLPLLSLSLPLSSCPLTSIIPHEYLYQDVIVRDEQLDTSFGSLLPSSSPPLPYGKARIIANQSTDFRILANLFCSLWQQFCSLNFRLYNMHAAP